MIHIMFGLWYVVRHISSALTFTKQLLASIKSIYLDLLTTSYFKHMPVRTNKNGVVPLDPIAAFQEQRKIALNSVVCAQVSIYGL